MQAIVEVYITHLEELQFCWEQLRELWRSPEMTERDLVAWRERLRAHLDGLLVVGGHDIDAFLEQKLEDPTMAFAAAYALLHRGSDAGSAAVLNSFRLAQGPQVDGLAAALCHAWLDDAIFRALEQELESGEASLAAAAAEVLAFHGRLDSQHRRLAQLVAEDDPLIRCRVWRVCALAAD